MAEETSRYKIPYPSKGETSYYDIFQSMIQQVDSIAFADFESRNAIMFGGGTLDWNGSVLTWTEYIEIISPTFGRSIILVPSAEIEPAGIAIPSGYFMYLDLVRGPTTDVEIAYVEVSSQMPISTASQVFAYHNPNTGTLQFVTGLLINSGGTATGGIIPNTVTEVSVVDGNATQIRSVDISTATPTNGEVLVYDSASNEWQPHAINKGTAFNFVVGKSNYATYNPNNASGKQTIQNAIDDASALIDPLNGVTAVIYIQEGEYVENLTVPCGITLVGAQGGIGKFGMSGQSRTKLVGSHTLQSIAHGGVAPFLEQYAGIVFKNIEFSNEWSLSSPSNVLRINDSAIAQAALVLCIDNCTRLDCNDDPSLNEDLDMTRFLFANLTNLSNAKVFIRESYIVGGYPPTYGTAPSNLYSNAPIYVTAIGSANVEIYVNDTVIQYGSAPLGGIENTQSVSIGLFGNITGLIERTVLQNGVYLDGGFVELGNCAVHGNLVDASNNARAPIHVANGLELLMNDVEIHSDQAPSASGVDGETVAVFVQSGTPNITLDNIRFYELETSIGTSYRASVDSSAIVQTRGTSDTVDAIYMFSNAGDFNADFTTDSGLYVDDDVYISGKLTVLGSIDPTDLTLTPVDPETVNTPDGYGSLLVSDGSGDTVAGELYFKKSTGSYSRVESGATGWTMVDTQGTSYEVTSGSEVVFDTSYGTIKTVSADGSLVLDVDLGAVTAGDPVTTDMLLFENGSGQMRKASVVDIVTAGGGSGGDLTNIEYLGFDTTATHEVTQGQMTWNADEETVDLGLNGAVLQLGQETHYHVRNNSGSDIPDGTAVMATGTIGNSGRITIAPMVADGSVNARYYLGVTTETIVNDTDGKVTQFGKVRHVDTSAFSNGDVIWLDPSVNGGFTATEPSAPNLKIATAFVVNSATNGTLFVRANNGTKLFDASDVELAELSDGEFLKYNGTSSVWESATLPNANTTTKGIVEMATTTEANNGTDYSRAVSPGNLPGINIGLFTDDGTYLTTAPVDSVNGQTGAVALDLLETGDFSVTTSGTPSGGGSLSYDGLGVFTFTPADESGGTTYTGSNGITLVGTDFQMDTSATLSAGTYGNTNNGTKIDTITVDGTGRITNIVTGPTGSSSTNGTVTGVGVDADSGTGGTITASGTISIEGGTNIETSVSGTTVTINATGAAGLTQDSGVLNISSGTDQVITSVNIGTYGIIGGETGNGEVIIRSADIPPWNSGSVVHITNTIAASVTLECRDTGDKLLNQFKEPSGASGGTATSSVTIGMNKSAVVTFDGSFFVFLGL